MEQSHLRGVYTYVIAMSGLEKYIKIDLRAVWLMVAGLSLTLPVFIPSTTGSGNFLANVIGTATATMFILSFPSSLFVLPLLFFVQALLGYDPNTIGGMYVNLWLLFAVGLVQWFWVVPRLIRHEPRIQTIDIPRHEGDLLLTETKGENVSSFYDGRSRTPFERVIDETDDVKR